jgi:hypothetical protein
MSRGTNRPSSPYLRAYLPTLALLSPIRLLFLEQAFCFCIRILDPRRVRAPARFCQSFVGGSCPTGIDISAFQPLPAQPVRQSRLLMQHLKIHVVEIDVLAQVQEQGCISKIWGWLDV